MHQYGTGDDLRRRERLVIMELWQKEIYDRLPISEQPAGAGDQRAVNSQLREAAFSGDYRANRKRKDRKRVSRRTELAQQALSTDEVTAEKLPIFSAG